jgi:HSP20 family protein
VYVQSTPNELVIQASVRGVAPDKVEISIEGDTLTIKSKTVPLLDNTDYEVQERRHGPFVRMPTLNVPVQTHQTEAIFDQGVLTLTIPKAEEVRPKVIKVKGN